MKNKNVLDHEELEVVEAELLQEVGEKIRGFFSPQTESYDFFKTSTEEGPTLYVKGKSPNPRATIPPMVQVNMVANAILHLVAQQIAILFHQSKEIDQQKVYDTTQTNIKNLVSMYMKTIAAEEFRDKLAQGASADA